MDEEDVVIFGAGGLGSLVQDILQQGGRYRPVAFLDSNPAKHGQFLNGGWCGSFLQRKLVRFFQLVY